MLHHCSCYIFFQLAAILPRKTVAERGPSARSVRAKKNSVRKRGGPPAAPAPVLSVQSKRARIDEASDNDADASESRSMQPSKVPVRSVRVLWLLSWKCSNSLYLLGRPLPKIQYTCSMSRLILLRMALPERMV